MQNLCKVKDHMDCKIHLQNHSVTETEKVNQSFCTSVKYRLGILVICLRTYYLPVLFNINSVYSNLSDWEPINTLAKKWQSFYWTVSLQVAVEYSMTEYSQYQKLLACGKSALWNKVSTLDFSMDREHSAWARI